MQLHIEYVLWDFQFLSFTGSHVIIATGKKYKYGTMLRILRDIGLI